MAIKYPGALPVKADLQIKDGVTEVKAAPTNAILDELIAIATELGIDVAGSSTNLVTRLAAGLHIHDYQSHAVTAGNVTNGYIDLISAKTYHQGDNSLDVFLNGLRITITTDYTETSTARITFLNDILTEDDIVVFKWWKAG